MVQINFALKEVNCKIVFYGPGMSGKTTNLEIVHEKAPEENKGELTSISTDGDRTLFFDFMPLDLGNVAGMRTKFQLYTVPGQVYYNSTRKLVLQGVDGVIFVADSDAEKMSENIESYQNLIENLQEYGKDIRELPHVIQYNKRDHPNAMSVEDMDSQLNKFGVPTFEAVAYRGEGVFPTLKTLAGMVLESIDRMDRGGKRAPAAEPARATQKVGKPAAAPAPRVAAPASTQRPISPKSAGSNRAAAAPSMATARPSARGKAPVAAKPRPAAAPMRTSTGGKPALSQNRRQAQPVARVPARRARGGLALVITLSVLLVGAAAGVVYFFMGSNLS
jgi:hypothetical protein